MTWTYSGDPSSSTRDEVRFLIGDTDTNDQLVSDEEIAYAVSAESTAIGAAIRVARAIALKFARLADYSVGDLSISYGDRARVYRELVSELESAIGQFVAAVPYAGGISVADKTTQENDSDRVKPSFAKGMHDNIDVTDDVTDSDSV